MTRAECSGEVTVKVPSVTPWRMIEVDRHHRADDAAPELLADDRVVVGQPRLEHGQQEVAALGLPAGDALEHAVVLLEGRAVRVGEQRFELGRGHRHHAGDDRLEQRSLRIEVVVERTL